MKRCRTVALLLALALAGVPSAVTAADRVQLFWENTTQPHPERAPWSDALLELISDNLPAYERAEDIRLFCPNWDALAGPERVKAVGEIWVATTFFESSYNPASVAVDVGNPNDPDTWSVGLLQVSVVDQASYRLPFGFSFDDLKRPIENLTLAHAIMMKQLKRTNRLVVRKDPYWAVLYRGNYDKVDQIARLAARRSPGCT